MIILMIALGAALLYVIQLRLYEKFWNRKLSAEITFPRDPVFEGETAVLSEVITNDKIFPLPTLQVKFRIDRTLEFVGVKNVGVSDNAYKNDIFSLIFYQKITRTLPFRCTKRGYFEIDRVDLVASNLFLTGNLVESRPTFSSFYVYPKLLDPSDFDLLFRRIGGSLITRRCTIRDPFEFRTIRDYTPEDPIRQVNWKASAKTSSLKVNEYEFTAGQELRILLNLEDMTNWVDYRLLERSVSLAASLAVRLLSGGTPAGITSNAPDRITGRTDQIANGSGTLQRERILQYLSRIDYSKGTASFPDLVRGEALNAKPGGTFLVISYSTQPTTVEAIAALAAKVPGVIWVLPYHTGDQPASFRIPGVDIFPWEVRNDD